MLYIEGEREGGGGGGAGGEEGRKKKDGVVQDTVFFPQSVVETIVFVM